MKRICISMLTVSFAAGIELAGDPAYRERVVAVIRHYDYSRLYSSRFFFAECAYHALPEK